MPHLRCLSCGVVSYAPVNGAGAVCPECGVPWPGSLDEVVNSEDPDRRVDTLLRMTRDLLDADVVVLTEIRDGTETAVRVSGEWPGDIFTAGASLPIEETFCARMLEGRIGNVVADAATDERVCDLGLVRDAGVGSWIGVPVTRSDAEMYVLCCLAREARRSVGAREVKLLTGLAASVRAELATEPVMAASAPSRLRS